jgi:outer membrane biogenesis lipoprotein LolB
MQKPMQAISLLLATVTAATLLSACSDRASLEYSNHWDQAFAQSMQGTKKKEGGI